MLLYATVSHAQTQAPLSSSEEREILNRLNNNEAYRGLTRELQLMVRDYAVEVETRMRMFAEEHARVLAEKKLHLQTLQALSAYRSSRRPRIVKILTFGIVGDKHDPLITAQIQKLQDEIRDWR